MHQQWLRMGKPKATPADIAGLEAALNAGLPKGYVDFVSKFGFVIFGRDEERRCLFSYAVEHEGNRVLREAGLSYLFRPERVLTAHRIMTTTEDPGDESRPQLPPGYVPIGSDPGQGTLLLEIGEVPGRIWFQPETEWRWGMGDNTQLGFVAEDFEAFINGLRPDPL